MSYTLLVVDDDELSLSSSCLILENQGYTVVPARNGQMAIDLIKNKKQEFSLVIMDFNMAGMDGADATRSILDINPYQYILGYSGDRSRDAIKQTWKAGAVGFIEKDGLAESLLSSVNSWCAKYEQTRRTLKTSPEICGSDKAISQIKMVGNSENLVRIARKILIYRTSPHPVLILGETGTGKELAAQAIHCDPRTPFMSVNCSTYRGSTELMESELFGYEKGSFTGATKDKSGILEGAGAGTVFFDEIHQLSLTAQAKLLRVFQEKKIRRVGGSREIPVKFRLVAAAKPALEKMVSDGDFLPDLFHRLNVLNLTLPPLRERISDLEPLIQHFINTFHAQTKSSLKGSFLLSTIRQMRTYTWPGNIRELQNVVYRLMTDYPGENITPEHLDGMFFAAFRDTKGLETLSELNARFETETRDHIARIINTTPTPEKAAELLGLELSSLGKILQKYGIEKWT